MPHFSYSVVQRMMVKIAVKLYMTDVPMCMDACKSQPQKKMALVLSSLLSFLAVPSRITIVELPHIFLGAIDAVNIS